jgi:sugar phosphate isomerase/epimerase
VPISPLSVQLYSVRDAIAADLPSALERIAAIGFTTVELYGFTDAVEEYRSALAAAGLTAPSGHAPALAAEDPSSIFEAAAALGVTTLIDPHYPVEHWTGADEVARTADLVNATAEKAAAFGLAFGYHNHDFEISSRVDGEAALEVFARRLDPAVVLELDTFWVEVGGESAPAMLGRLGDRVRLIHVKNGPLGHDTKTQLPADQGDVDVPAVLAAAPDAVRVVEFDDYAGDPFDGLAASFAYLDGRDR